MRLLGNILWFLFGGWALFIMYTLAAIIFFPVFNPIFRIAKYSLWPFGKDVVREKNLRKYKELKGEASDNIVASGSEQMSGILNILWLCTFGWILALLHLVCCLTNVLFVWLIVTIPNIGGHWKMISIAFMPFNTVLISSELAKEMELAIERDKLNL